MEITTSIVIKAGETKIILTRSEAKFLYAELQKWLGNESDTTKWYPRAFKPMIKKPVKLCDTPYNINVIK